MNRESRIRAHDLARGVAPLCPRVLPQFDPSVLFCFILVSSFSFLSCGCVGNAEKLSEAVDVEFGETFSEVIRKKGDPWKILCVTCALNEENVEELFRDLPSCGVDIVFVYHRSIWKDIYGFKDGRLLFIGGASVSSDNYKTDF